MTPIPSQGAAHAALARVHKPGFTAQQSAHARATLAAARIKTLILRSPQLLAEHRLELVELIREQWAAAADRPRVDVSDLVASVVWLHNQLGRRGSPLASCRRSDDCRTLGWTHPATGMTMCLTPAKLAALVDTYYRVVKVDGRGEDMGTLFPTAAAARVLESWGEQ